jgi:septal ring factor EnvC (AmiA/AmiB activator)
LTTDPNRSLRLKVSLRFAIAYRCTLDKKKIKKLQQELKEVQLDRDSKNDQIDMLKSAVKRANRQVDDLTDELKKIEELEDELAEARELYDRVKMENEVLLDQSVESQPVLDTADENILSMILCQSYAFENALSQTRKK